MARLFSYLTLTLVKALSGLLYRFEVNWINQPSPPNWKDIKLIVFLNHTSLFEPIFVRVAPQSLIWRLSKNLVAPGADITLKRPIVGTTHLWTRRSPQSIFRIAVVLGGYVRINEGRCICFEWRKVHIQDTRWDFDSQGNCLFLL